MPAFIMPGSLDNVMGGNPYSMDFLTRQMPAAQSIPAAAAQPPENPYLQRNMQWVKPGEHTYNTPLPADQEAQFRQWVQQNSVPFDPNEAASDYDMRGFWKALQAGDPIAKSAVDPNDKQMHYPDYWKTPYHETFSAESQWADPGKAPKWNDKDQLVMPDGTVIFDDRKRPKKENGN